LQVESQNIKIKEENRMLEEQLQLRKHSTSELTIMKEVSEMATDII